MSNERMKSMGSYERLFGTLPPALPSPRLCERVVDGIRLERARAESARFFVALAATLASLAGTIYAIRSFLAAASASGFTSYASLVFSDGSVVSAHASAFFATLLDSVPGPEAALALALIAVLIQSTRVALGSGATWHILRTRIS